jgi:hypothetical protein
MPIVPKVNIGMLLGLWSVRTVVALVEVETPFSRLTVAAPDYDMRIPSMPRAEAAVVASLLVTLKQAVAD